MGVAPADLLVQGKAGRTERLLEVDALRGLAALAVVLYHFLDRHEETLGHASEPAFWLPWGLHGVQLFFVISGFVIFMTLDRTQRPMDFVVSRFARLYPVYWAALVFTLVAVMASGVPNYRPDSAGQVAANLTMWQSLLLIKDVEGAYWTLYVELCFYATMLALFVTRQLKHIERWAMVGMAIAWLYWLGLVLHGQFGWSWRLYALFGRVIPEIPFFVIGIAVYRLFRGVRAPEAVLMILFALVTIAVHKGRVDTVAALIATTAFGMIVAGQARLLRIAPLVGLGAISYSLYLVHNYAGRSLIERLQQDGVATNVSVFLMIATMVVVAVGLTFLIEQPARRAINHWYRQRRSRALTADA